MPGIVYRQLGVKLWGAGAYERESIDGSQTRYPTLCRVGTNDLVVNKIWARHGSVAIVPGNLAGSYVSSEFPTFIPILERVDPMWLSWLTKTKNFWRQCELKSHGTSGKNRITSTAFLEIEIPLPTIVEQVRIVGRLEELAQRISEVLRLRKESLGQINLFASAISRKLFADPSKSWVNLSIEEACEAIIDYRGRTPPTASEGIPHLTTANIKDGKIHWETSKFVSEEIYRTYMKRGIPQKGDVILTMEAPLGDVAVVPDERRFSLAQRTLLLRGKKEVLHGQFLAKVLTNPDVRSQMQEKATGTTVKGISSKRLRRVILPIPSLEEQDRIVSVLDLIEGKVAEIRRLQLQTNPELEGFLPSVLDRAVIGEL
jgi:type I restriction enzyme S subunit